MKRSAQHQRSVKSYLDRNTENPKYELEEVNISGARDTLPQELKLNKITTFSLKINNMPKSPSHVISPSSTSKPKLPPIAQSINIYDYNLFRPQILTDKPKHSSKAFSISSPKSPNGTFDPKLSPKPMFDITIDPEDIAMPNSPSPHGSRRHDSFVNLFIGPKRMESAIPNTATFRDDKNLAFKTIHSSHTSNPQKLVSTLVRRKEQLEGFIISKVYKWPDNRVTLKECMKPVINTGTRKFVKKIVKNFKPIDSSAKKSQNQRDSAAPIGNPVITIEKDVFGESNEVTKL